jgi:hypothetical protein
MIATVIATVYIIWNLMFKIKTPSIGYCKLEMLSKKRKLNDGDCRNLILRKKYIQRFFVGKHGRRIFFVFNFFIWYFNPKYMIVNILVASSPPVNPNGKGGLVAQAFAVVIFGLGKFNIKRVLISIVKIWSKTCTSRRSIFVFSKNGICSTCWRMFLENKAIWVWEFSIRSAVPSYRRSEMVCLYYVSCILVTSSTKSPKN